MIIFHAKHFPSIFNEKAQGMGARLQSSLSALHPASPMYTQISCTHTYPGCPWFGHADLCVPCPHQELQTRQRGTCAHPQSLWHFLVGRLQPNWPSEGKHKPLDTFSLGCNLENFSLCSLVFCPFSGAHQFLLHMVYDRVTKNAPNIQNAWRPLI